MAGLDSLVLVNAVLVQCSVLRDVPGSGWEDHPPGVEVPGMQAQGLPESHPP